MDDYPLSTLTIFKIGNVVSTDKSIIRCNQIIIKPTKSQRNILYTWFNIYRFIYNYTVSFTRQNINKSFISLRKDVKASFTNRQRYYIQSCPVHIIDEAIHDVVKAYKTCKSNKKAGNIRQFRLRHKKQKCPIETMAIPSEYFSKKDNAFVKSKLGVMKSSTEIKSIKRTSRLTWNKRNGQMILYNPIDTPSFIVEDRNKVCSLDPGLRTFQTVYSKDGLTEYGKGLYSIEND